MREYFLFFPVLLTFRALLILSAFRSVLPFFAPPIQPPSMLNLFCVVSSSLLARSSSLFPVLFTLFRCLNRPAFLTGYLRFMLERIYA